MSKITTENSIPAGGKLKDAINEAKNTARPFKPYWPRVLVDDITGNTFRYYGFGAGSRIDLLQHDTTKPVYDIKWLCELAADLMTWHFEDIHVDNYTTLSY